MKIKTAKEGYLVIFSDPLETEYYMFTEQSEAEAFFRDGIQNWFSIEEIEADEYGRDIDECVDEWEMVDTSGTSAKIERCNVYNVIE